MLEELSPSEGKDAANTQTHTLFIRQTPTEYFPTCTTPRELPEEKDLTLKHY